MSKNKVILFIDSFKKGGAERVCSSYASIFYNNDIDVEVWTYNIGDKTLLGELSETVYIKEFKSKNGLRALFKIIRAYSSEKNVLFIAFNHQIALLLIISKILTGKANQIVARNVNYLSVDIKVNAGLKNTIVSFLTRHFYKKCDGFISQCNAMKYDMINKFGIAPEKIRNIYNPLSTRIEKKQQQNTTDEKETDILFVGRLERQKGIEALVDILNLVVKLKEGLKIKIVGDGTLKSLLENVTTSNGAEITHIPSVDNMSEVYSSSRVVILTSLYEGFPNVLIEALGCGVPVVSFDCPSGPSEIIEDGKNGFLIPVNDKSLFSQKIIYLLSNNIEGFIPERLQNGEKDLLAFYKEVFCEN